MSTEEQNAETSGPVSRTPEEWIEHAETVPLAEPQLETLGRELDKVDVTSLLRQALLQRAYHAAIALVFANRLAGRTVPAEFVGPLLAHVEEIFHIVGLVACTEGDRVRMLLDSITAGHLSREREVLALCLSVRLLEGKTPPDELLIHLRLKARHCNPEAGLWLGLAAAELKDEGVQEVAAEWIDLARSPAGKGADRHLSKLLQGAPRSVLPEQEPPKALSGFTIEHRAPRVGRNDPCPCGSGKKYKRCCINKAPSPASQPAAPSAPHDLDAAAYRRMTFEQFDMIPAREVARIEPARLPTRHLVSALRTLSKYRMWEPAEQAMEELQQRDDLPGGGSPDGYREELLHNAIKARAIDVARRQLQRISDPEVLADKPSLALELLDADRFSVRRLEKEVLERLRQPDDAGLIDLAWSLLDLLPGLGILVARGVLDPTRNLDSDTLLEGIEEARDRLLLPPHDPAAEQYDLLVERWFEERAASEESESRQALTEEMEQLRDKAQQAARRVSELQRELDKKDRALERTQRARAPVSSPQAPPERPSRTEATDPMTVQQLKQKTSELKGLIAQGNRERAGLRKELARLAKRLVAEESSESAAVTDGERVEDLEIEAEVPDRLVVMLPHFSAAAQEGLKALEGKVARETMETVGRLAAGDPACWRRAKALRRVPGLRSVRIGHSHRLLVRPEDTRSRLEVLAVIHRRDLEKTLRRLP